MLILLLAACTPNPMADLQALPNDPLELDRDYAPAFAGCSWTRERDDGEESIAAHFDPFGRLLDSRQDDVNGLREVTNTWDDACLVEKRTEHDGELTVETFTCDEHGHATSRGISHADDEGPEYGYTYVLDHDGDDWTGWASPNEDWARTYRFDGVHLVEAVETFEPDFTVRTAYSWEGDRLVLFVETVDDAYNPDQTTTWTYDDAGRLVSRAGWPSDASYTYVGDEPWPTSGTSLDHVYAYTFDCD